MKNLHIPFNEGKISLRSRAVQDVPPRHLSFAVAQTCITHIIHTLAGLHAAVQIVVIYINKFNIFDIFYFACVIFGDSLH